MYYEENGILVKQYIQRVNEKSYSMRNGDKVDKETMLAHRGFYYTPRQYHQPTELLDRTYFNALELNTMNTFIKIYDNFIKAVKVASENP